MKKTKLLYSTIIFTILLILVSTYSYAAEITKETLKGFFEERGLAWSAVLTSYEYTAQDTLELIQCQVECPQSDREVLFDRMSRIRKE